MGEHNDDDDARREALPITSRIDRGSTRGYRVLTRASGRNQSRDRFRRQRKQRPVVELIGMLIRHHGLTDEVRQRCLCLFWPEIAGERFASRTYPVSLSSGLLHVSVVSSTWVQEMHYFRQQLIAQINRWVDANSVWLGAAPLATDIRFGLGMQRREVLVDPERARELRLRHQQRIAPKPEHVSPTASDAEREAIRREASAIDEPDLRAVIEAVRMKWNR